MIIACLILLALAVAGWWAWYRAMQMVDALDEHAMRLEEMLYERAECNFTLPGNKGGAIRRVK